jgi:hypothetical protein
MPLWPFFGQLRSLDFDLDRWVWTDGSQLFDHSVKKGWNLLKNRESLQPKIPKKWPTTLLPSYNIKWNELWRKNHAKKDAGFIWALYHKVIHVNAW